LANERLGAIDGSRPATLVAYSSHSELRRQGAA
jgi:hypothetical protein